MSDLFKLQREVSETTANINPDDVFNVKNILKIWDIIKNRNGE